MQRNRSTSTRVWATGGTMLALAWTLGMQVSSGQRRQPVPDVTDVQVAKNFEFIGNTLVDGRPVFKIAIQEVKGRWYLYGGSAYHNGWSIMDVTDPRVPKVVNFIPGPKNTSTAQMDWAEGRMITPLSFPLIERGQADFSTTAAPTQGGFYIWDSTDPVNPKRLGHFKARGTHRNWYDGARYVHAAVALDGYDGMIYMIVDISNPVNPVEVSRWSYPGQHTAAGEKPPKPGISHHGPAMPVGNLVYLAYGTAGVIVLDISDIKKPKMIGNYKVSPPFFGGGVTHTVFPIPERNIAIVSGEAHAEECEEPEARWPMYLNGILDISNPAKMEMISYLPRPVPPPGAPFRDFCEKGGRFGPHNVSQHTNAKAAQKQGEILFQTYFNAGLRAFDISDPKDPKEVGYFVPEPAQRYGSIPFRRLVTNFEDMLVDARGYIYCTDRNSGIWIVRYTGPKAAQATASLR